MELFACPGCCYLIRSWKPSKLPTGGIIGTSRDDFDWLLSREIPHLRRYAHALVHDPVLADDLVQDCLERALRKWRLWRPSGRIRSWLFRMLYRIYLNQAKKRRRDSAMLPLADGHEPAAAVAHQGLTVEVGEIGSAIDRLPDDQRAAILLVALEGVNYDEAAWILGIPVGTLRSRLSRGRETLRSATAAAGPGESRLRRVK